MKNQIFTLTGKVLMGLILSRPGIAQVDQNVPSMNPTAVCRVNGAEKIKGIRNYEFLTSDDCRTIFVRPETLSSLMVNYRIDHDLDMCQAVKLADQRIVMLEEQYTALHMERYELESQPLGGPQSQKKREKRLAEIKVSLEFVSQEISEQLKLKDSRYGVIPGATFQVTADNRVLNDDLNRIALENLYNVIVQIPGQEAQIFEKRPAVRKAIIADSYYSFFYRKASEREAYDSVLSTDAPLKLVSDSPKSGTVHVQAGEMMTAQMTMNLPSICRNAVKKDNMEWELTPQGRDPIFTLNRTYTVLQRMAYGYDAKLNLQTIREQMAAYILRKGNEAFSLEDLFLEGLDNRLKSYLEFTWLNESEQNLEPLSPEVTLGVQKSLFANFITEYIDDLVANQVLVIDGVKEGSVKDGQTGSVGQAGCIVQPISKTCQPRTYRFTGNLQASPSEIVQSLETHQSYSQIVGVNHMAPFTFTATFQPQFQNLSNKEFANESNL